MPGPDQRALSIVPHRQMVKPACKYAQKGRAPLRLRPPRPWFRLACQGE